MARLPNTKRLLNPWFLTAATMCVGGWATYVACPGCIERDRVNKTCDWTGDSAFPIDLQNVGHQKHLVADAHLAEELAVRHADAEFGKRFGVEHHGGLIDNGRFRRECLFRMFDAIESNHNVTSEQIRAARGQRDHAFDLAVTLLFVPLYSLGASVVCRWLFRRFSPDSRYVQWVAMGWGSIAISFLGVQGFRLFAALWEGVRVGNGHISGMRLATYNRWSHQYIGADYVVGVLLFWIIALWCSRILSKEHNEDVWPAERILLE